VKGIPDVSQGSASGSLTPPDSLSRAIQRTPDDVGTDGRSSHTNASAPSTRSEDGATERADLSGHESFATSSVPSCARGRDQIIASARVERADGSDHDLLASVTPR
jgi:hypothetical protein